MGTIIKFTLLLGLLYSCGKNIPVTKAPQVVGKSFIEAQYLEGSFDTLEGDPIKLDEFTQKPSIIIFASDTCEICNEEAKALSELFAAKGSAPTNVHFYTLVITNYEEDAQDFIRRNNITWSVGLDRDRTIFKKYCPENRTPCVLAFKPLKEEITKFVGASTFKDWQLGSAIWKF